MATIQMFGHISGAHFNPAVSIGMALSQAISPTRAICYTLAQSGGGVVGGFILKA